MTKSLKQYQKLYQLILENYGHGNFKTYWLRANADSIGMDPQQVGACLDYLKRKGLLVNGNPRKTRNGHKQMVWHAI
ncbi:hypothetical protein ACPBEI_00410 [Latilactobacillus sakei]